MHSLALVFVVCLTSLGAWLALTQRTGRRARDLRTAAVDALACLGLAVVFLAANLAVGIALILGARALTRQFISLYVLNDATLAVLSLLQALVFHAFRSGPRQEGWRARRESNPRPSDSKSDALSD